MSCQERNEVTQPEADAAVAELRAHVADLYASWRTEEQRDALAVLSKIEESEAMLRPHMGKEVIAGWTLEGWNIQPKSDATALWPIEAGLHFRHQKEVGHEASVLWGETGSDEALDWLISSGFPVGDLEVTMV